MKRSKQDSYAQGACYRYLRDYGIKLDMDLVYHTYDIIQWWKWLYYGCPNGSTLPCLPREFSSDPNCVAYLVKYVIENEIGYDDRQSLLKLNIKELKDYKIHIRPYRGSVYKIISELFQEYDIKPFELSNVPLDYWKVKTNCDEYMEYILAHDVLLVEVKKTIPSFFTFKHLRKSGHNGLVYSLNVYHHYGSYYDWISTLHPEWELSPEDFSEHRSHDGYRLNSHEEVLIYNHLTLNRRLSVEPISMSKTGKLYNIEQDEYYVPDFIIHTANGNIIVEYFGLYRTKYGRSEILKTYYEKTHRKLEYYQKVYGDLFLPIFPFDLTTGELDQKLDKLA